MGRGSGADQRAAGHAPPLGPSRYPIWGGFGDRGGGTIVEQPAAAGWSALARGTLAGSACVLAIGVDDTGRLLLHAVAPAPPLPVAPAPPAPSWGPGDGRRSVVPGRRWGWFWTDGSATPVFPVDPAWGLVYRSGNGCLIDGIPYTHVLHFDGHGDDRYNAVHLSLPHDLLATMPQPSSDARTRPVLHAAAAGLVVRWDSRR